MHFGNLLVRKRAMKPTNQSRKLCPCLTVNTSCLVCFFYLRLEDICIEYRLNSRFWSPGSKVFCFPKARSNDRLRIVIASSMVKSALSKKKNKKEPDRVLIAGKPDYERCDNKVVSARYTPLTFLPVVRLRAFLQFGMFT